MNVAPVNEEGQSGKDRAMQTYNPRVTPWQIDEHDFPRLGHPTATLRFLIRYAILAPSSHNTQPWKFSVENDTIRVYADKTRWLRVADADQRELHLSVGCALENLLVAAEHFRSGHRVDYAVEAGDRELVAAVKLVRGEPRTAFRPPELFDAIPIRTTNHKIFHPRPISDEDRQRLLACCAEEGIELHLTENWDTKRRLEDLVVTADATQFANPAFREELGSWVGRGVFGTPWPMARLSQLAVSHLNLGRLMAKKDSQLLMSAPLVGLLTSTRNDRKSQVQTGQVFERIYLTATAHGISLQPLSQVLQVPEVKQEVANLLGLRDAFPQQPFRMGYATEDEKKHTPRRPVEEVIV